MKALCNEASVERQLTKIRQELLGENSTKTCRETWQRSARRDGHGFGEYLASYAQRVGRTPARDLCELSAASQAPIEDVVSHATNAWSMARLAAARNLLIRMQFR